MPNLRGAKPVDRGEGGRRAWRGRSAGEVCVVGALISGSCWRGSGNEGGN